MRVFISSLVNAWKSRFWLTPVSIILFLIGLQFAVQLIDTSEPENKWTAFLLSAISPEGARLILSAIAGSLMTVVGVLFSLSVLFVQQLARTYSPRLVHSFIRSTPSQIVLGMYIGSFSYALLLLRRVRGENGQEQAQIPELGLSVGIFLAMICLGLLIYYIQHLSRSFASTDLLKKIRSETIDTLNRIEKDTGEHLSDKMDPTAQKTMPYRYRIVSRKTGYLQVFEWSRMARRMKGARFYLELKSKPGEFLNTGSLLMELYSERKLSEKDQKTIADLFEIGEARTFSQDPSYGVRQMVDIALKAISPAVNDPETAVEAVNEIGVVLLCYTRMELCSPPMSMSECGIMSFRQADYEEFLSLCFDEILLHSEKHPRVSRRILDVLEMCENAARSNNKKYHLFQFRKKARAFAVSAMRENSPGAQAASTEAA